jgi:hypothetical protein
MAADTKTILGLLLAAALAWLFWRYIQKRKQAQADLPAQLFADILPLLDHAELKPGEAIGTWQITGSYRGNAFQLKAITDTLAVRKLPSLWLMVTLPGQQPIAVTIDLMMRPQGPTTFSNFDFLPHTLRTPRGFPEDAVIRSDRPDAIIPEDAMRPHLSWLQGNRGKELLLSSKGLRMVLQAAEADRARYGVFREANFGERAISATLAQKAMDTLLAISDELRKT